MTASEIEKLVRDSIGDAWDATNAHKVNLRKALVTPRPIKLIQRLVRKGKLKDSVIDGWLVLIEDAEGGYRIVADQDGQHFGLASEGSANDKHLVLCGWYGDFMSTFKSM